MTNLTIDALRRILVECAGESDYADLHGDIADVSFENLGYDSLALMEAAARIKRQWGVAVPDQELVELKTPRELRDAVNGRLVQAV